jgi:hypothetical protein
MTNFQNVSMHELHIYLLHEGSLVGRDHLCLSAYLISETTQQISLKFSIGNLHFSLTSEISCPSLEGQWNDMNLVSDTKSGSDEFLTAVFMKGSVFSDISPCGWLKVNRHFRGTIRLNYRGRGISQARKQL